MAVVSTPLGSVLIVEVQTGINNNGNPVLRSRRWSNVKAGAPDQDVFEVGAVLGSLQTHIVTAVRREDAEELANA